MNKILIRGGVPLSGKVRVQGSKNAALPILAATLLAGGEHEIKNCPKIADVYYMLELIRSQGAVTCWKGRDLYVDTRYLTPGPFTEKKEGTMRSSIFLLGAMLGRFGEAELEYPGGCVIGDRPVNWHIDCLEKMGVRFEENSCRIRAKVCCLKGIEHTLPFPSVGLTENLIMAAVLAEGITVLHGAAREPEIAALCEFLNSAGACIVGGGRSDIVIKGVTKLQQGVITLPGDRIVAGTYALGCMITGGEVLLENAPADHMTRLLPMLHAMGGNTLVTDEGIYLNRRDCLCALPYTATRVYPGFPTDLQSPLLAALCTAEGESTIEEQIFTNRFRIVPQLQKMGAEICVRDCIAHIRGVEKLHGCVLTAQELRGGAALVLAGLGASGVSTVEQCCHIERGYENICRDLTELGARIYGE